jgi:putative phosphoribosyl transferase
MPPCQGGDGGSTPPTRSKRKTSLAEVFLLAYPILMHFKDRRDAGQQLIPKLEGFRGQSDVHLFALPRGGTVVGAEIAKAFDMPLDLIVTRKIGAPYNEEYALGALAETGETIWNDASERASQDQQKLETIIESEKQEAKRRIKTYRNNRPLLDLTEKTALIVDDGLATGATMRAAIAAAKHQHAKRIVVVVPHGAHDSLEALRNDGLEVIALHEPKSYSSVGQFYDRFGQTSDDEVIHLMNTYGKKET